MVIIFTMEICLALSCVLIWCELICLAGNGCRAVSFLVVVLSGRAVIALVARIGVGLFLPCCRENDFVTIFHSILRLSCMSWNPMSS